MKAGIVILLSSLIVLSLAGPAARRDYLLRPDGSGDFPDLRTALALAINGDEIVLAAGVYGGSGNRDLDFDGKGILLRGQSGDPADCVLDAEGLGRHFRIASGEGPGCILRGLTLRNGLSADKGGAVFCRSANPTIENCVFENCIADEGGALYGWNAELQLSGCVFRGNQAAAGGALACREDSHIDLSDCLFEDNSADFGGAVFSTGSLPVFKDCSFGGNVAVESGGALYLGDRSEAELTLCTLAWNEAPLGAGLTAIASASVDLNACIIAFGAGGEALSLLWSATVTAACTNIYGHAAGDWTGDIAGQLSQDDNGAVDPMFCASDSYLLNATSPCAEANHACGRIGAWDVGCGGAAPREEVTQWGLLKSYYR